MNRNWIQVFLTTSISVFLFLGVLDLLVYVRTESSIHSHYFNTLRKGSVDNIQPISLSNEDKNIITSKTSNEFESPALSTQEENAVSSMWPKVAWLMSFPESGTTFTLNNVMEVSNTTVARNNAPLIKDLLNEGYSIPFHSSYTNGPFLESTQKLPTRYILTSTHCSHEFITSPHLFLQNCCIGRRTYPSTDGQKTPVEPCKNGLCREEVQYNIDIVKKVVHLIRDPFDNIIARFNNEYKRNTTYIQWLNENPEEYHEAFHSWCKKRDKNLSDNEMHYYGMELPNEVSCYSEFFRYVQWHNNAFALSSELGIPTLILHYSDYSNDMESSVKNITSFLELEVVVKPLIFSSHDYKFIFSEKQRKATINWILGLATKPTRDNLGRYFHFNSWPKIAWLLSYPASGTTFTLSVVTQVSNRTVAYNQGHHFNRYSQQAHFTYTSGPFLDLHIKSLPVPDKYILTKNHCHHPSTFLSSPYLFRKDCLSGKRFYPRDDKSKTPDSNGCKSNWCEEEVTYDIEMVKKIVYNIRNPFDNIVARFNNPQKRNTSHAKWLRENPDEYRDAFHTWCRDKDSKVTAKDIAFYGKELPINVPCKSEFFRYFQWHNYAFALTAELQIPKILLYYENYKNINETVDGLIKFLELDPVAPPLKFSPHSYSFMYSDNDRKAIADWAKEFTSKEVWKHLEHYFNDIA